MGFFSDTYKSDEDEELPFKRSYIYYDTTPQNKSYNPYAMRFLSSSYIRDLSVPFYFNNAEKLSTHEKAYLKEKTRQVFYKNISQRTGKNALAHLMKYLARDLPNQDTAQSALIYDSNHTCIEKENISITSDQFSKNFIATDFKQNNSYIIDLLDSRKKDNRSFKDVPFEIWRIGTTVRRRNNWQQECRISEMHKNNIIRIEYQTPEGDCSEYINRKDVVPTVTPEGFKIFNHSKSKNPEKMFIAHDDSFFSIHRNALVSFERNRPHDFHHLTFSIGGNDYNQENAHEAFKEFLDDSFKSRGFDFLYCFHNDTENPHYHVICKDQASLYPDKRFPKGKRDSLTIRRELNHHLFSYGIERSVTKLSDQLFPVQKEQSLFEKLNTTPIRNNFKKQDLLDVITKTMDQYYLYALEHKAESIPILKNFEEGLLQAMNHAKKKELPNIINNALTKAKSIDNDLHVTFEARLKTKPVPYSEDQIKKNRIRLLKNLTKAKKVIEKHPHPLSRSQQETSYTIDHLIEFCQKKIKKKVIEKDKEKILETNMTYQR